MKKKEEDDFNRVSGFPAKASPFSVGTAPGRRMNPAGRGCRGPEAGLRPIPGDRVVLMGEAVDRLNKESTRRRCPLFRFSP